MCALLPLLATGYQIAAKSLADGARLGAAAAAPLLALLVHPMFLLLIGCETASFAVWIYVLARMPLSEAFPMSALGYVFVIAASHFVFHEPVGATQLVGSAAIMTGAWLIGSGAPRGIS